MSILLEQVTKHFAGQRVVENVSLDIAEGELFVLLGASGSGKSTVLRLIAGLSIPDAGRVHIAGRDVTDLPPQARGAGFVFQNYSLFRHMTVAENVEFPLKLRGVSAAERAEHRDRLLDLVDLTGLGARLPEQLSGGQRQRVALARALIYAPTVLLLDEPFGALDAKIRTQLRRSLKGVQDALGVTTVLVTHDQEEAFELGDRIAVLERGRLLEDGRPEDIYHRPRTLFVATFVGAGTVLAGQAVGGRARIGHLDLPLPPDRPHEDGATVQLLARPEDVLLAKERPDDVHLILGQGRVAETVFMGSHQRWRVRLPHQPGCRQLAPRQAFGEQGIIVEAAVSDAALSPDDALWVALRRWHFLEPGPRHLLVPVTALPEPQAFAFADLLSRQLGATLTLLGVAQGEPAAGPVREVLDAWARNFMADNSVESAGPPSTEVRTRLRVGNPNEQVLAEQREAVYDLLLLPGLHIESDSKARDLLRAVLEHGHGPVLIGQPSAPAVRRVLICTAAGEPGKSDVRVGGWLAGRLGAEVTLFYASTPHRPATELTRIHLDRAAADLMAADVACMVKIESASTATAAILNEAGSGEYDLVVMGSHRPTGGIFGAAVDVTWQIISGARVPVLVVPAEMG